MKKLKFRHVYFIYLGILAAVVIGCIIHVYRLLGLYEELIPEKQVQNVMDELVVDAQTGNFWEKYCLPRVEVGSFEADRNVKEDYLSMYTQGDLEFSVENGAHAEDELLYAIEQDGNVIARVKLKAKGPAVTKLTVLNFREWQVESVKPVFEARDYECKVPDDFEVTLNGKILTQEDGTPGEGHEMVYTVRGLYLPPEFEIKDQNGADVKFTIQGGDVLAEFYYYSLTLPSALQVSVDGAIADGEDLGDDRVLYNIRKLEKPEIIVEDLYGNREEYLPGTELAMTCLTLTTDSRDKVLVEGQAVPETAVVTFDNKEYTQLVDYVEDLPQISEYHIAVLKENADIAVTDENGQKIPVEPDKKKLDVSTVARALDSVPQEVASEIDVLDIAQKWSLFMSNDVKFANISHYFLKGSYQYNMASRYAHSIDITFTSRHVLLDPAFTEEKVENFIWITEDCFSVDIGFIKHMRLSNGDLIDDTMNDRFYFVRYDDTNDGKDNPAWKLVSMKENVNNEKK